MVGNGQEQCRGGGHYPSQELFLLFRGLPYGTVLALLPESGIMICLLAGEPDWLADHSVFVGNLQRTT